MMPPKGPSIAVLLGKGHVDDEEEEHEHEDGGGEDEFDDLSEPEIVEHKHAAAEEFLKAIEDGSPQRLLKAFEALHGLDHAAWDHEGGGEEDEEPEEEPEHEDMEG
jgi:hypothetical protein